MEPQQADVEFRVTSLGGDHATLLQAMARFPALTAAEAEEFTPANDGIFLVAYVRGHPAGCGGYRELSGPPGAVVEFARLYVRPGAQRAGLARAIIGELERSAVDDDYDTAVARLRNTEQAARALLEVTGYRVQQRDPDADNTAMVYSKRLRRTAGSAGVATQEWGGHDDERD